MSLGLYLLGFVLLLSGVGYGLTVLQVPGQWLALTLVVMVGLGIMSGLSQTRIRNPG